ncbi:hypothetical protein QFC19_006348 [Naganishia cerealis]|uniref:Uncharacterized protein n=1 Tax=Naganishia cerealis TaxID=610337 RepID=A0ACC2VHC5_9TREE|nr:hypothetical protein QFC19_006348 [Naganishia cerealis]
MAGYLTERARLAAALKGQKSSVKETPLLWDFMSKESMKEQGPSDTKDQKLGSDCVNFADISPISITPLLPMPPLEPIPVSSLKYFPNAMAFRAPKPEISAETILKDWEAKLKSGPNLQQDADHDGRTGGRKRGRTRGKSLLEQYPQQHVPPLRLSIERPRPRKTSRAAELADQLGNKIFGPPSLPARVPHGDIDLEAQVGASASSRANTGVEMVQIGTGVTAASNATHVVGGVNPMQSPTDTRKTATIPPTIQLMTFVRMPIPEHSRELVGKRTWHMTSEEEQEKAVQAEWAGVELGVTEMEVVGNTYPTGGDVWGSSR